MDVIGYDGELLPSRSLVMLATADDDVGLASFETLAAAGQDAADRLGVPVTARDALTDEVIASFEPS
jgi:hypothetical protein